MIAPLRLTGLGLVLLLCAAGVLAAPKPVAVDPLAVRQSLSAALLVIADPQADFDPAAVRAGARDAQALPAQDGIRSLGYIDHPYWLRLQLAHAGDEPLSRLLVLRRGSKYAQQLWIDQADGSPLRMLQIGAGGTVSGDLSSRHAVIRLQLPPRSLTTVTVRLNSVVGTALDYELVDEQEFARAEIVAGWLFGSLFGLLLAIGLYVFALFVATREWLYAWFTGFAFGLCSYVLHFEGYPQIALWGEAQGAASLVMIWSVVAQNCFTMLFARGFLDAPRHYPRLDRWLMRPMLVVWLLAALLYPWQHVPALKMIAFGAMLAIVLVGAVTALARWRGQIEGWLFPAAVLAFWLSSFAFIAKQSGALSDHHLLGTLQPVLSGAVMLLFALAVAQRFRRVNEALTAAIRRNEERLEITVAERTAELSEAKARAESALTRLRDTQDGLVVAEKMASLGQLVAGVAHEVNTPLGVAYTASSHLQARTEWLQEQLQGSQLRRSELLAFGAESAEGLRLVCNNLERAAALVRNFKQISVDRSSEGRRQFVLADYLAALADSLAPSWRRAGVAVHIDCPPGLQLDSYPGPLGQIITQLVQNALQHAYDGIAEPRLDILARSEPGDRCLIELSDNGRGVDADTLRRMFDPFFTTRRGAGGTGLGLSMAFNLAHARLGGSLGAEALRDGGLRMNLRIPCTAPG